MAQVSYYGTGRRKSSVARVRLVPGDGKVTINGRAMEEYFGLKTLELIAINMMSLPALKAAALLDRRAQFVTELPAHLWNLIRVCVRHSKKPVLLLAILVKKSVANTVSRRRGKRPSSPNVKKIFSNKKSLQKIFCGDFFVEKI